MRPRIKPLLSALVVAGLALVGCGVPTDRVPRSLPASEVPFNILASDVVTTSTTVSSSPTALATIYLVAKAGDRDRLQAVDRLVPTPPTVEKVVRKLLSGASDAEARRGLRTAVPAGTTILSAPVASAIATIDLSGAFVRGTSQEQIIALAQIVFTATSLPGVVGVRFTLEGRPTEVPAGDGTLTQAPLGRASFASYGPA
jgi:spore germination protein GerM